MSLHEMGGLTTEECEEERCIIVRQMRKLQRDEYTIVLTVNRVAACTVLVTCYVMLLL